MTWRLILIGRSIATSVSTSSYCEVAAIRRSIMRRNALTSPSVQAISIIGEECISCVIDSSIGGTISFFLPIVDLIELKMMDQGLE